MADGRGSNLSIRDKAEVEREGTRPGLTFRPDVDIHETSDEYIFFVDVPGVDEKGVDVRLEKGVLSLDARLAAQPDPGWRLVHGEYRVGSFHREFRISDDIDMDAISASLRDGVLELHLPKSARHRPRTIEVRVG